MNPLKAFIIASFAFIALAMIMFGVVAPVLEWAKAIVLAKTGSEMLANLSVIVPFAAFFGLIVAAAA